MNDHLRRRLAEPTGFWQCSFAPRVRLFLSNKITAALALLRGLIAKLYHTSLGDGFSCVSGGVACGLHNVGS